MFLLSPDRIDRIVHTSGKRALAGLTLIAIVIASPQGWRCGWICGFVLWGQGLYYFKMRRWRTERGVWMLAALLVVLFGSSFVLLEFEYWQSVFNAPRMSRPPEPLTWGEIGLAVDAVIAIKLCGGLARLAASVTVENWKCTRDAAKLPGSDAASDDETQTEIESAVDARLDGAT